MPREIEKFSDLRALPEGYEIAFGVIYTIDVPWGVSIRRYQPEPRILRLLSLTEGDEEYDYSYLEGEWASGKHRKYVGVLSLADFESVALAGDLVPDPCETMGSLGVPWAPGGYGVAPAISFNGEGPYITGAYVTPLPMRIAHTDREKLQAIPLSVREQLEISGVENKYVPLPDLPISIGQTEEEWQLIKKYVLEYFG